MWLGDPKLALYAWPSPTYGGPLHFPFSSFTPPCRDSRELYEAGNVDGTNAWQSFRYIMLPLIAPTVIIVMILRTTWAFQVFDEIFV